MQELQIILKCGQPLSIRNMSDSRETVPEFSRFLNEFRSSPDSKVEKIFMFKDPCLGIRLSEVAYVTVLFIENKQLEQHQTTKTTEVKKRAPKKTPGTKAMN